jgi:hypothetical protein
MTSKTNRRQTRRFSRKRPSLVSSSISSQKAEKKRKRASRRKSKSKLKEKRSSIKGKSKQQSRRLGIRRISNKRSKKKANKDTSFASWLKSLSWPSGSKNPKTGWKIANAMGYSNEEEIKQFEDTFLKSFPDNKVNLKDLQNAILNGASNTSLSLYADDFANNLQKYMNDGKNFDEALSMSKNALSIIKNDKFNNDLDLCKNENKEGCEYIVCKKKEYKDICSNIIEKAVNTYASDELNKVKNNNVVDDETFKKVFKEKFIFNNKIYSFNRAISTATEAATEAAKKVAKKVARIDVRKAAIEKNNEEKFNKKIEEIVKTKKTINVKDISNLKKIITYIQQDNQQKYKDIIDTVNFKLTNGLCKDYNQDATCNDFDEEKVKEYIKGNYKKGNKYSLYKNLQKNFQKILDEKTYNRFISEIIDNVDDDVDDVDDVVDDVDDVDDLSNGIEKETPTERNTRILLRESKEIINNQKTKLSK